MADCDVCGHNAWSVEYPCERGDQCPFWIAPDEIREMTERRVAKFMAGGKTYIGHPGPHGHKFASTPGGALKGGHD